MSKFRPMSRWDRLCAGEFIFELALGGVATATAALTGFRFLVSNPPQKGAATASFVVAAFAFVVLGWRAVSRNRKAQHDSELHALDGVLHALHAIMMSG